MENSKVYTSYFANLRNIPSDIEPVAISLFTPNFYNGKCAIELAPSKLMLNGYKEGVIDQHRFTDMYLDLLFRNSDRLEEWISYFKTNKVVLVCYEGRNKFCHRHILADLLNGLGFEVEEL